MSMFLRNDYTQGPQLDPQFQMSNALAEKASYDYYGESDWYPLFWEVQSKNPRNPLPRPVMYLNKPRLHGFIKAGFKLKEGLALIASFNMEYELVSDKLIRLPTLTEYKRYFDLPFRNYAYRIINDRLERLK